MFLNAFYHKNTIKSSNHNVKLGNRSLAKLFKNMEIFPFSLFSSSMAHITCPGGEIGRHVSLRN